jgi:ribosome-binding protein aMBF1 (putative translation factor)
MITNEFQYRNTKAILAQFEAAIENLEGTASSAARLKLRAIEIAAVRSQAESLREELVDYERLRSGEVDTIAANGLLGIAELLIKARVARGWTQARLAEALGVAVQQVQRYEATGYSSASLARLADIAVALGIEISETATLRRIA